MDSNSTPVRFWTALSNLVWSATLKIDRPKGSRHPRYPDRVYPLDYGYLEGTTAADRSGIDVWIGSLSSREITGAVCTVDAVKRDAEIKILLGCTPEEATIVLHFHNDGCQSALLLLRPQDIP